ncbi:unnamed protein product [Oncorhynchus mykiss]|uniref:Uncharacterized protein n=1 Tax=Oncorhynchus mykiss TaxID=8022 RepID=A0A060VPA2_ONCMY|nr:unnamed protein product [Oncorhynchus mykiss]
MEMTSLSSKHQEELLRMTTLLNHKEDALRTLKETLRRSQQEGEQLFMGGEDLHARLTTTRGRTVQSNILLEKNKLEEVKRPQKRISELVSRVSTQQGDIFKWKARAVKLKERRDVVETPPSACTHTKRRLPMTSEDLNSPKKFLDSPKRKFFDVRPGSECQLTVPSSFLITPTLEPFKMQLWIKKEEWWPVTKAS